MNTFLMKIIPFTLLLVALVFASCTTHKSTARMTLYLDESFNKEAQTCYVWGFKWWISNNEFAIFDSARIKKRQTKVRFKVECPMDMSYYFCFTKQGPVNERVVVQPRSKAKLYLKPSRTDLNGSLAVSGKGTEPTVSERLFLTSVMDSLQCKIENANDVDSQNLYKQQMTDSLIRQIQTTPYPSLAFNYYIMLRTAFSHHLKDGELDALKRYLQNKFDTPFIRQLETRNRPISGKGQHEAAQIDRVLNLRKDNLKQDTALGSSISLSLYNLDNRMLSLQDIGADYTLVEFWASWCKPCQKEIPYLKEVLDKYGDKLSIYAVSIDRYPDLWKKGISRDGSERFIHVIGSDRQGLPNAALQGLGIKSIPSNFLLDNQKRIVAKNLRGERLMQVMDSLLKTTSIILR